MEEKHRIILAGLIVLACAAFIMAVMTMGTHNAEHIVQSVEHSHAL